MTSIINDVKGAPETFSSWDKCMEKAYCKWPAIAGIVVGSLILLSVLFCLFQCLCCGYSCAKMLCCCCNGCDCGGKDRRRGRDDRPSKYQDSNYHQLHGPNPYSGYQPPAAMAPAYRGPQTATFEGDTKGGDALPAMPSWDNAVSHRVEVNDPPPPSKRPEDLEMGRLNPQNTRRGYDQVPLSPTSPTHAIPGYFSPQDQNNNGYQSDIGSQRLNPQTTGYNTTHGFEQSTPSSPAPTYQTHAPQQPSGDRFIAGAASPSPYGYQPHTTPSYHHQQSPPPAIDRYNDSPYYDHHQQQQQSAYTAPAPRQQTFSPPPAGSMPASGNSYNSFNFGNESTPAYEPYNNHSGAATTSPREARPPSLLQVGRKAVPGSTREV